MVSKCIIHPPGKYTTIWSVSKVSIISKSTYFLLKYIYTVICPISEMSQTPVISGLSMFSICSNHYNWGKYIVLWFPLKVASIFIDLVCSVQIVSLTTGVNYSFRIYFKSGFHISWPNKFSICRNHYNWDNIYILMISSKSGCHISVFSMFCICSNQ